MDPDAAEDAGQGPTTEDVDNREQATGDEAALTSEDAEDKAPPRGDVEDRDRTRRDAGNRGPTRMEDANINRETGRIIIIILNLTLMFLRAR